MVSVIVTCCVSHVFRYKQPDSCVVSVIVACCVSRVFVCLSVIRINLSVLCLLQEAQVLLRNVASAIHFFLAKLFSVTVITKTYVR